MAEELGIIKGIEVGMRDVNSPICWFNVELLGGESLQILSIDEMKDLIIKGSVYRLYDLNGRSCIVDVDRGTAKFKRLK